jgi:redox-sensitive bicupin YhaK (pirin superfamily)
MKLRPTVSEPANEPVIEDHPGRAAFAGATDVQRLLPTVGRRLVGAWCFMDHAGPLDPGLLQGGVGPHPHAGLQTVSWLYEGEIEHRDSLGAQQIIRPGQLNLMTSGRGITHAELMGPDGPGPLHGLQLWVALPDADRNCAPAFDHYSTVPTVESNAATVSIMLGEHAGVRHDARTFSPLVGLDVACHGGATSLALEPEFEHAALVSSGQATIAGRPLAPGTLRYLGTRRTALRIEAEPGARVLILGGTPLGEPVLMWWNFVAREHEEIIEMREAWASGRRFGEVKDTGLARMEAPPLRT